MVKGQIDLGLGIKGKIEGEILHLEIDISKKGKNPSKSGKSTLLASTEGNITVPDTNGIILGLNCYIKREFGDK